MPQLAQLDATELLPQIHAAEAAQNDWFAATLRCATSVHAAPAVHGASCDGRDVLVTNAIDVSDAAVRYADAYRRLAGLRRATEHGANIAAAGAAHAESVHIPEFL